MKIAEYPREFLDTIDTVLGVQSYPSEDGQHLLAKLHFRIPPAAIPNIIDVVNNHVRDMSIAITTTPPGLSKDPNIIRIVHAWETYLPHLPKFKPGRSGPWQLRRQNLQPEREIESYDPVLVSMTKELPRQKYVHVLRKGEDKGSNIWMSTSDMELATMSENLGPAHGKVLVGGLGMGIFPTLAARCKRITSITVVEADADIIAMTKQHLHHPKVEIIHDRFEEYCQKAQNQKPYDYIYVDIWPTMIEAYSDESATRETAALVSHPETEVSVWCQRINDRKRAVMLKLPALAQAGEVLDITSIPCFACLESPRADIKGLCTYCAANTWQLSDYPGNPKFPIPSELFPENTLVNALEQATSLLRKLPPDIFQRLAAGETFEIPPLDTISPNQPAA